MPAEIIDRPKGYFPVPGIRHLEGTLLDQVRAALTNEAARARGLFRRDHVTGLLDRPNDRSNLGVNIVWQLELLEMWLQMERDILRAAATFFAKESE